MQSELDVLQDLSVEYRRVSSVLEREIQALSRKILQTRKRKGRNPLETKDAFAAWWGSYLRGDRDPIQVDAQPVRFVDLYSSVGGLSLGAVEAIQALGMRPVPLLAVDVDGEALKTYRRNLRPREVVHESVRSLVDFRVLGRGPGATFAYEPTLRDSQLAAHTGRVDLILAGPPCQGHSTLNNHSRGNDPKNLLYLTVPAIAVALKAEHVVIENVPNVVNDQSAVVETTQALLHDAGYRISAAVLAADQLGWPQTRKRYFLIASRGGAPLDLGVLAEKVSRDALPVSWILQDSLEKEMSPEDLMWSVPALSRDNQRRIDHLFDNDLFDLPNAERPDCHKDGTTYGAVYGRMHWDRPAPTITTGFLTPGRGRFTHPRLRRVLTPREAARIQGFPDWFKMIGENPGSVSRADLSKWIGDAVPTILGYTATIAALAGATGNHAKVHENDSIHQHAS